VREVVREAYAGTGRPSIDRIVFFKLQLVMFFEGIRSERKLLETASLNLAHRWYLGYALDGELPDNSSLTRIRQRLGIDVFQRFFEQIADLCQKAGLVRGKELYFGATKVEVNADLDSLVPRFCHGAKSHIAGLFADGSSAEDELKGKDADPPSRDEAAAPEQPPRWKLLEERRLDPHRPAVGSYRRTTDFRVSLTDPDATPMRTGGDTSLGYHDHYVVGGAGLGLSWPPWAPRPMSWRTCRCAICCGGCASAASCGPDR
jgi:transposase